MNKKTKRSAILMLFAAFAVSVAGFAGCNNQKPEEKGSGMFRENVKTDILVESCIDVEDYIVKFEDAQSYTVNFEYTDEKGSQVSDTVKGVTYYPMTEGEYLMVYRAELPEKILVGELALNVYGNAPEITVADYPLVYEKGDSVSFSILLMAANPYSEQVDKFKIEKVKYYRTETDLEETVVPGSEKETVFDGEDRFTFDEYGTYEFTFSGTYRDKTSYSTFRVEVVEEGKGNDDVQQENGAYLMKNAVVNGDIISLVQAEYSNASYVVMEGEYYDQDVIRVEFKGKNCPNIGFLTIPNEQAFNPYDLFSGYGNTFSMEHLYTDKFSIYGYGVNFGRGVGRFAGMNLHNGNSITGYMGRDNLENDKYYAIELNIDSGSTENLLTVFHLRIFELENYGEINQTQKLVYTADVPAGNVAEAKILKGKLVFYGSAKENIAFRYFMPVTKVENFELNGNTVTWNAIDGAEYYVSTDGVNYQKQAENSYTFENFIPEVTPLYVKAGRPGTTLLGGAAVFNVEETEPYTGDAFEASPSAGELTVNANGDIKHVNATAPFVSAAQQTYVATTGDYAPGTYIMMEFRGASCPGRLIFGASELSETADSTVGAGFTFDYNWGTTAYYKKDSSTAADVSAAAGRFINMGKLNRAYFTGNEGIFAGSAANKSSNFVLVAGAENTDGGIRITYYLYKISGNNELTLIENNFVTVADAVLGTGKIAVLSSNTDSNITTRVKLHEPGTYAQIEALMREKYNVFEMGDYLTLSAGAEAERVSEGVFDIKLPFISGLEMNYAATAESYAPGTFVLLEFKGANYPAQILFGVSEPSGTPDDMTGAGWHPDKNIFAAYYYHKADAASPVFTTGVAGGKLTRGYLNEMVTDGSFGDITGNKEKNFVLMAGASNSAEGIVLKYALYEKMGDSLTLIEEKQATVQDARLDTGSIVIAGTNVVPSVNTEVRMYTPGTESEITAKLSELYDIKAE